MGQSGLRCRRQGHRQEDADHRLRDHQRVHGFPAISAVEEGYRVFAVVDASGTYSKMAQEITLARVVQAGVVPIDTGAVASELQRTWNRKDAQE